MVEANKEITYAFRFSTSDKCLRLTQQQLDCIPYLSALITYKDDFSSTQNEGNELVVDPSINYHWFMVIFDSIISNQPYTLFNNTLLKDENILDILKLFGYLGAKSFSSPLLKDEHLNPIYHVNQERDIAYHRANTSEARNTAEEFILALSKKKYYLHYSHTVSRIFSLIMSILGDILIFFIPVNYTIV